MIIRIDAETKIINTLGGAAGIIAGRGDISDVDRLTDRRKRYGITQYLDDRPLAACTIVEGYFEIDGFLDGASDGSGFHSGVIVGRSLTTASQTHGHSLFGTATGPGPAIEERIRIFGAAVESG